MSTALQSVRLTARSCACSNFSQQYVARSIGRRRAFATTPLLMKRKGRIAEAQKEGLEKLQKKSGRDLAGLFAENDEILRELEEELEADVEIGQTPPDIDPVPKHMLKDTFLNMGDPEPFEEGAGFPEEDQDDISSLAHRELEQHREWRHYARLAAWEMPLLSKLAKPFEPPTGDMPLRFRYTTYMGESHPAEKKVVLEFSIADMPNLTSVQREKLKKLVGVRYNPETDVVRMSCEMHETQAQNKRYLGDMVGNLLKEARDPTDTFEDVPLDTRHHHFKPKPRFPREWLLTEERKAELEKLRQQATMMDQQREAAGLLVDGVRQIQAANAARKAIRDPFAHAMADLPVAGKGKGGKKVAVRR
ncbi:mitochondrial ribosomal subunit protein-domain-containing protein [Tricladium varicosporioides]|nr:mitochondrial ribosomal subunit protein-domain-containing protein [Hymenoscyphus varicosporioides]